MLFATKNASIGNGLFDGNLPIRPRHVVGGSLGCLVLLGVILHFGVFWAAGRPPPATAR